METGPLSCILPLVDQEDGAEEEVQAGVDEDLAEKEVQAGVDEDLAVV